MQDDSLQFPTRAIKATTEASVAPRPVSLPLYLSTTYHRNADGSYTDGLVYSRADNPNRRVVEKGIAALEEGDVGFAFASGMAAVNAVFQSLRPGDHVIIPDDVYFNVLVLLREVYERWGLSVSRVDMSDLNAVSSAIQPNTALVWVETPSNPQLKLTDITGVATLLAAHPAILVVDNTWPTPVHTKPLLLGADIVVHSTTKYFGGHSDVLSGCLVVKADNEWAERIRKIQVYGGGVPAPFDCWLVARGLQTLHLRVTQQSQTALALATYLVDHPNVEAVNYPGLPSNPQHELALRQMQGGFGGMLSVLVKGGAESALTIASRLQLFATATSLGGTESLVEHRKSVEGPDSATPDNLLRLSIGMEAASDLMDDWEAALG